MTASTRKALVKGRHRTVPIPDTIKSVPRYPAKLVIFRIEASPFYWVRYYDSGRIYKRSTKTDQEREAFKVAIAFYEELLTRRAGGKALGKNSRFEICAREVLRAQEVRIKRGELGATLNINEESRLRKHMLPYFRDYEVGDIDYYTIESYFEKLGEEELASATIKLHASLLNKILKYAHRKQLIPHMPPFPTVETVDSPRSYFNSAQYARLRNKARALVGQEIVERDTQDRVLRYIRITQELNDLILFMVNSFVRPTDIKVLKNAHVEIVGKQGNYLRLVHPATKKHYGPMISMPAAVEVFKRQREYQKARGYGADEDYVFMPEHKNRDYALTQLRRQFDYVLDKTRLKTDATGNVRTLYSLRHTALTFRILNAEGLDLLTLAKNARTSVEMLERFYLRHFQAEQNVERLHSRKRSAKNHAVTNENAVSKSPK
jgi:hypothetical protein